MNLGDQLKYGLNPDSEFSFLAYLDDINIGPSKSDIDLLMKLEIHCDIDKIMSIDELIEQLKKFVNLIYARQPRFVNNYRVTYKRFNMQMARSRYLFLIRYN